MNGVGALPTLDVVFYPAIVNPLKAMLAPSTPVADLWGVQFVETISQGQPAVFSSQRCGLNSLHWPNFGDYVILPPSVPPSVLTQSTSSEEINLRVISY